MDYHGVIFTDVSGPIWSRGLGAYRLATELRKRGYRVKVIDCLSDFSKAEIETILKRYVGDTTLFVGISTSHIHPRVFHCVNIKNPRLSNQLAIRHLVSLCRKEFSHVKILLGGARVDVYLPFDIDVFVTGYCENSVDQLLEALRTGAYPKGYILPSNNDKFDFDALDTVYNDEDCVFDREALVLETSRGCRFRCRFCDFPLNGRRPNTYFKSKESLRCELLRNYERHGITTYLLSDDTFNESLEKMEYMNEVFRDLPFELEFFAYLRLELIRKNPQMIDLLREMGLRSAYFGIESLNDKTAKAIGKGMGRQKTLETLGLVRSAWGQEVFITASFIVGLPHESTETVSNWLPELLSPDFPADYLAVFPLFIPVGNKSPFLSEFARYPERFGYHTERSPMGPYWRNEHFDTPKSEAVVADFYRELFKVKANSVFGTQYVFVRGYGFTHHEVMRFAREGGAEMESRLAAAVSSRIQNYKSFQLGLVPHQAGEVTYSSG